jgi:hypothetical protein
MYPAAMSSRAAISLLAVLAVGAFLLPTASARAAGDDVERGSLRFGISGAFTKQLRQNGVKMSPRAFKISEGAINPLNGAGEVSLRGRLRFRRGAEKIVFRQLTATLPADGEAGYLRGKGRRKFGLLARNPTKLFSLRGGKVARNGFGARVSRVKVRLLRGAAKRVNRKLDLHSLRRARVGSLSVSEQPKTVAVTGGTATVTPNPNRTVGSGTIASKLADHCIPFISGSTAIAPGVENDTDVTNPFFVYPVRGGTVGPHGDDGEVELAGGQRLANSRVSGEVGSACKTAPYPPVGVLEQTDFKYNLLNEYLSSHLVVGGEHQPPLAGDRGEGIGSNLDLANATVAADPEAHTVMIKGIVIRINKGGALNLNSVFQQPPSAPFNVSQQFAAGDLNATADLLLTIR